MPAGAYHPKYADDILAYSNFIDIIDDHTQQSIDGMAIWSKENHMRLNTIMTQHMIISKKQQQSTQQLIATLNDIDLKSVEKYEYLVVNNSMNYDAQWEVTSSEQTITLTFSRNSDAWVSRKTSSYASTKA